MSEELDEAPADIRVHYRPDVCGEPVTQVAQRPASVTVTAFHRHHGTTAVSYTHLTLPTKA